ncbi:hypothetical protein CLV59_1039 [Chitinophaga dinghuensis]|uniref:Uncharacterized protein n=1 Tax=Chitinophaga dinghuensis TaxID=1539050 RepID=A0A327W2P8_9BACT|nr:hypothetical protein [Chitinophaga dinghuensis]RAJ83052.1 hypothetical protein CLV59_1039 [Chitinophaga dinghuensis]
MESRFLLSYLLFFSRKGRKEMAQRRGGACGAGGFARRAARQQSSIRLCFVVFKEYFFDAVADSKLPLYLILFFYSILSYSILSYSILFYTITQISLLLCCSAALRAKKTASIRRLCVISLRLCVKKFPKLSKA